MSRFILYVVKNLGQKDSVELNTENFGFLIITRTSNGYNILFFDRKVENIEFSTVAMLLLEKAGDISINKIIFDEKKLTDNNSFFNEVKNRLKTDKNYELFISREKNRKESKHEKRTDIKSFNRQFFDDFYREKLDSETRYADGLERYPEMTDIKLSRIENLREPKLLVQEKKTEFPVFTDLGEFFSPSKTDTRKITPTRGELVSKKTHDILKTCNRNLFERLWHDYNYGPIISSLCYVACLNDSIPMPALMRTWDNIRRQLYEDNIVSQYGKHLFIEKGINFLEEQQCYYGYQAYNFLLDLYSTGKYNCEGGTFLAFQLAKMFPPANCRVVAVTQPKHVKILMFYDDHTVTQLQPTRFWEEEPCKKMGFNTFMTTEQVVGLDIMLRSANRHGLQKTISMNFFGEKNGDKLYHAIKNRILESENLAKTPADVCAIFNIMVPYIYILDLRKKRRKKMIFTKN
jgi:hypothetical protein